MTISVRLIAALVCVAGAWPVAAVAQSAATDSIAPPFSQPSSRPSRDRYSIWSQSIAETEPIIVEGKEFTVRDVIRRATAGEGTKLSGHRDLTYYYTIRVVIEWPKKRRVETSVYRAYQDSTGYSRILFLDSKAEQFKKTGDEWELDDEKDPDQPPFRVEELETSYFTRLPFYLDEDDKFDFKLLGRTLESDRVVFHIAFRPKSDFSPLPSGEVYIDSKNFQVVHEVYEFTQNPFPLMLKGIRRASRQWTQLAGGEWVRKRIALDIELRNMPFAPDNVLVTAYFHDFAFDTGYDERLFGEAKREVALPLTNPPAAPVDSIVDGGPHLLSELQEADDSAYPAEAAETEAQFTIDTIARHDSLGLTGISKDGPSVYGTDWKFGASPALLKWDYNRVEGFLFGGEGSLGQADPSLAKLSVFAGYATGSEEFRYSIEAKTPIPSTNGKLSFSAWYRDRVDAFGSNRIALNSVRAFVWGADDQDYLHRLGGGGKFGFDPSDALRFELGFEASEVSSVGEVEDFSIFGDNLDRANPNIDPGDENDVVAGVRVRAPNWLDVDVAFRTSGGALGGDFRFNRTDITVHANRYLVGRHGLDVTLKGVTTADAPPFQYLADIGGLSTVRGYDLRTRVGDHSFAARVEYPVPYDLFALARIPLLRSAKLQWSPWFDAGRVGDGDSRDWITSAGVGLQRYIGPFGDAANVRVDFAIPFESTTDDYVFYLWFVALR